ncbi:MAG: hypothetical protein ACLFUB_08875 [Cyclobacteriaceae bacterium]
MNHISKFLYLSVFVSLVFVTACKKDDPDPEPEVVPGEALRGTWVATQDNAVTGPAADQFANFSITITPTADQVSYTTNVAEIQGDPLVFPASGTFIVDATDNFQTGAEVLRETDDVSINMDLSEDGNVLTMNFTIAVDAVVNGRVAGINGEYTFILNKQ